jgi:heme/copper-type cytochrome/quinol oxidase subunit 4
VGWIDGSTTNEPDTGSVIRGFFKGAFLGFVQALATFFLSSIFGSQILLGGLLFFGLIQLIYVIPLFLSMNKDTPDTAKGLAIYAALVALLNGVCAVVVS